MEELTMEDLEGRRIWERLGRRAARSYNVQEGISGKNCCGMEDLKRTRKRPLRVSRRARSTALWVALRSAVLARLLGLRLGWLELLGEEEREGRTEGGKEERNGRAWKGRGGRLR